MTLYDAILLLRAQWRWFVTVPACSLAVTITVLWLVAPRAYIARALVASDAVPRAAAILSSRTLADRIGATERLVVEPRRGDPRVVEISARAATPRDAIRMVRAAIATVNMHERARLERAEADRRAVLRRRDPFAIIDYQSLTKLTETLGTEPGLALELLEPVVAHRPSPLQPYPLVASLVASLVVVFAGVFISAWWVAEREARRSHGDAR